MTMVAGTEVYNADKLPVQARGVLYTVSEIDTALKGSAGRILWDTAGQGNLRSILATLAATEFADANIKRILSNNHTPENWRVGEALAEAFLVEHRDCKFPWPAGRDLKNPSASPAGTDLVGFQKTHGHSDEHRFAFGEVKTSGERAWPPNVVYGRHGLQRQIEILRDDIRTKDNLVKYLAHHAANADWLPDYRSAAKRYVQDSADVSLFGILVRDVEPKLEDLERRALDLCSGCNAVTSIELRAMYLAENTINTLAQRATIAKGNPNGQG